MVARRFATLCVTAVLILTGIASPHVAAAASSAGSNPFGAVDVIQPNGKYNLMVVQGWLIDPDGRDGVDNVALYVDGVGVAWFPTGSFRPDVQAVYPDYGPDQGFFASFPNPAGRGTHELCTYGINRGPGGNVLLGCRAFTVTLVTDPIGSIDAITRTGANTYLVEGWVLDAGDAVSPTPFTLLTPGDPFGFFASDGSAGLPRPDVDAAFPTHGTDHGFSLTITYDPVAAGSPTLCIGGHAVATTSYFVTSYCRDVPAA